MHEPYGVADCPRATQSKYVVVTCLYSSDCSDAHSRVPTISSDCSDTDVTTITNFASWVTQDHLASNQLPRTTPPKLPSFKHVKEKLKSACDRALDGDLEEYFYTVPEKYSDLVGLKTASLTLTFQNPVSAVVETLLDPSIACADTYIWQPTPYTGVYSGFNTGNWWRDAYRRAKIQQLPTDLNYCILPITMYTDKAAVGAKENRSVKPISVACHNLAGSVTRTSRGQRTVGYWPPLEMTKKAAASSKGRALRRHYFHWVISKVSSSIEVYRHGVRLQLLDGVTRTLIPVWANVVTDWPEGQEMTNVFQGATNSKRNCRVCRTRTSNFGRTDRGAVGERRVEADAREKVKEAQEQVGKHGAVGILNGKQKKNSMYYIWNGWWDTELYANPYGVHAMFPMDILHTVPYGIIKTLKEMLLAHAKLGRTEEVLNARLKELPKAQSLRIRGWYYR